MARYNDWADPDDRESSEVAPDAPTATKDAPVIESCEHDRIEPSARRWRQLLTVLDDEGIRRLIPATQTCEAFVEWAPVVARYSFQTGRVLYSRW